MLNDRKEYKENNIHNTRSGIMPRKRTMKCVIAEPAPENTVIQALDIDDKPVVYDDIEESEDEVITSESEGEEPQYGTWKPDASCFIPETIVQQPQPQTDTNWRIGLRNDDAEIVLRFYREKLEPCDKNIKTPMTEIATVFNDWREDTKGLNMDHALSYNRILWDFLSTRYGGKNNSKTTFWGIRLVLTEEELDRKQKEERKRQEREKNQQRDKEELEMAMSLYAEPESSVSSGDEEEATKKEELKRTFKWHEKTIHRHPEYQNYGGDLKTGEIFRLKRNTVSNLVRCCLDRGVVLSNGRDESGKRIQKYKSAQQFIADCGNLKRKTEHHTKLMINAEKAKNRPFMRFYPLDCLSYETEKGVIFDGNIHNTKPAVELLYRCRNDRKIDDYIESIKKAFEEKQSKLKEENHKFKQENHNLKQENIKLENRIEQLEKEIGKSILEMSVAELNEMMNKSK